MKKENESLTYQADGATDALQSLRDEIDDMVAQQVEEKEQQMEKVHIEFNKTKEKLQEALDLAEERRQDLR